MLMNYRKNLSLAVVSLLMLSSVGQAGRIDVVNENKKALRIKIQAEGDTLHEMLATYVKEIPSEHYFEFRVDATDLKGKSHYSIKGDTSPLTAGDKCQHLSVEKNYKVTFLNDVTGTTCVAEEVEIKNPS
jgi:DNA-directed RNA polymerase subunit L